MLARSLVGLEELPMGIRGGDMMSAEQAVRPAGPGAACSIIPGCSYQGEGCDALQSVRLPRDSSVARGRRGTVDNGCGQVALVDRIAIPRVVLWLRQATCDSRGPGEGDAR